ncbi:MAG: hypothetical protein ACOYOF_18575, partial [Verrucomicrobiaceae bacterium]
LDCGDKSPQSGVVAELLAPSEGSDSGAIAIPLPAVAFRYLSFSLHLPAIAFRHRANAIPLPSIAFRYQAIPKVLPAIAFHY